MKRWKRYQQEVANLFTTQGCQAEIEKRVQGARAKHWIDVWVTFSHFGIDHRWAVECKDWQHPIRKEKVLAFKTLVEDVGADRGILVADAGFQRGAIDAAQLSNILPTSLVQLRAVTRDDLLRSSLVSLEQQADTLSRDIFSSAYVTKQAGPNLLLSSSNPAFDGEACGHAFAQLSAFSSGIKEARFSRFPAVVSFGATSDEVIVANNLEEFVKSGSGLLSGLSEWWARQKAFAAGKSTAGPPIL